MLGRLKQAFKKGPDSAESPPDTTELLAFWRERDPHHNAETTPPETESIDLNCLWAVELYTPDHMSNLIEGFHKLGWDPGDPDDLTNRDPVAWIRGLNRYGMDRSWMNLGVLVSDTSDAYFVGPTHRVRLPTGVSHATAGIHSITPSLIGVVICFVFEEAYSKVFDRLLRKQRRTYTIPTRRGQRIQTPNNQKHDDVNRIRAEISQSAAAWFRDNLPGEFASGTLYGDTPTCELVTIRNAEPFPTAEERSPGTNRYLSVLGLQDDFNVWRSVDAPKLKVKLRLSINRDPINHAVAAIKEGTPLWKNELQGNDKSSRIGYLDFLLPYLFLALATHDMLEGFHRRIRKVRRSTMFQDERKRVSTKVLQTLRDHLSRCTDVSTIASELATDSKRRSPASVLFEPFESCPIGGTLNTVSLNESIKSAIGDSATRLQSAVQSTGEQITQFGSMLGAAENIRIQRKISVLTWVLVLLTIALTYPLLSLAARSWGPSVIGTLIKLWTS